MCAFCLVQSRRSRAKHVERKRKDGFRTCVQTIHHREDRTQLIVSGKRCIWKNITNPHRTIYTVTEHIPHASSFTLCKTLSGSSVPEVSVLDSAGISLHRHDSLSVFSIPHTQAGKIIEVAYMVRLLPTVRSVNLETHLKGKGLETHLIMRHISAS